MEARVNYSDFLPTIAPEVEKAVNLINNIEIDPETRQSNLEILFRQIGDRIYMVVYDMNAFDFEIVGTMGVGQGNAYYNLAKTVSDSVSTMDKSVVWDIVDNWLYNVVGKAQKDATNTAVSLGKYVTVIRELRHSKSGPCAWCESKAGTHVAKYGEIDTEIFGRHENCHCKIITQGFHGRNGTLNNYKKGSTYVGEDKDYKGNQGFYEVEQERNRAS